MCLYANNAVLVGADETEERDLKWVDDRLVVGLNGH